MMVRRRLTKTYVTYRQLPFEIGILTPLLTLTAFAVGVFFNPILYSSSKILTTLATTQAGLLAIVFSVTILGVQLVTTRYSPRLVTLFVESPLLKVTFAILVASIALDVGLLYAQSSIPFQQLAALTVGAGGLALGAVVTLYAFIREALERSTPEGTLRAFDQHMTVDRFYNELTKYSKDKFAIYPLHPLYSLTMGAIDEGRMVTAKNSIAALERQCESVITDTADRGWETHSPEVQRELLKAVLHEYLHDIAIQADKANDHSVTNAAVALQQSIGEQTLNIPSCDIPSDAVRGMAYTLRDAPIEEEYDSTSEVVWNRISELYTSICKSTRPDEAVWAARTCEQWLPRAIHRYEDSFRLDYVLSLYFRHLDNAHEALIKQYGDLLSSVDLDWRHEHVPDDAEHHDSLNAVWTNFDLMTTMQATYLNYILRADEEPTRSSSMTSLWKNACIRAAKISDSNYPIALCQTVIATTFIFNVSGLGSTRRWERILGEISVETDSDLVRTAFEELLSYEYQEENPRPIGDTDWKAHNEKFVPHLLAVDGFFPLNTKSEYRDTLLEIREQVRDDVALLEQ